MTDESDQPATETNEYGETPEEEALRRRWNIRRLEGMGDFEMAEEIRERNPGDKKLLESADG